MNRSILQHLAPPSLQSADTLRLHLATKFDVVDKDVLIAGTKFSLLKVRDTNKLVDAIDQETFAEDERLPYWADIWTSSLELARWCLEEADIKGKRVLELGCGLGLPGIAAAKAGARVVLSDYEQDALDFARYNAVRNLSEEILASNVTFLQLDWRNLLPSHLWLSHLPALEKFDMIIAADVVYERRNFFPLIDVLTKLLKPDGIAVITEPGRTIGEYFFNLLKEEHFHLATSKHNVELDGKRNEVTRATIRNS